MLLKLAGIHGTKDPITEKVPSKNEEFAFQFATNRSVCIPVNLMGKQKTRLQQAEEKFQSLD